MAFLAPVKKTTAQEWQFLHLDAIGSCQRQIGPYGTPGSYVVVTPPVKPEDAAPIVVRESYQCILHVLPFFQARVRFFKPYQEACRKLSP